MKPAALKQSFQRRVSSYEQEQLELVCLGVGMGTTMAFAGQCSTAMVLRSKKSKKPLLLVDAGLGVTRQCLNMVGEIPGTVFLTHNHTDHAGEIDVLVAGLFERGRTEPVEIVGHADVLAIIKEKRLYHPWLTPLIKYIPIKDGQRVPICQARVGGSGYLTLQVLKSLHSELCYGFILRLQDVPILAYSGDSGYNADLYRKLSVASTIVVDARQEATKEHAGFEQVAAFREQLPTSRQVYVTHYGSSDLAPSPDFEMEMGVYGLKTGEAVALTTVQSRNEQFLASSCFYSLTLFEGPKSFYIVGSDRSCTRFGVLHIRRDLSTEELHVKEYGPFAHAKCQARVAKDQVRLGLTNSTAFAGLLGVVRLPELHLVLVTERRNEGALNGHRIYSIKDTVLLPIPISKGEVKEGTRSARYKTLFRQLSLTHDFYFSYTYDLTHSLQHNLTPRADRGKSRLERKLEQIIRRDPPEGQAKHNTPPAPPPFVSANGADGKQSEEGEGEQGEETEEDEPDGFSPIFCWNWNMAQALLHKLEPGHSFWILPLVHGFFQQQVYRGVRLSLIARRSRHMAGCRYLRRGIDKNANVANEVETEQIIGYSHFGTGEANAVAHPLASLVTVRGSIPMFWEQVNLKNPKPDVKVYFDRDSDGAIMKKHLEGHLRRYGSPLSLLNLIKQKEKTPREILLGDIFKKACAKIQDEVLTESKGTRQINYFEYDFINARKNKGMSAVTDVASMTEGLVETNGYFSVGPNSGSLGHLKQQKQKGSLFTQPAHTPSESQLVLAVDERTEGGSGGGAGPSGGTVGASDEVGPGGRSPKSERGGGRGRERKVWKEEEQVVPCASQGLGLTPSSYTIFCRQEGAWRINCMDCLDRTNVAMYIVGKAALKNQLRSVGLTPAEVVIVYPVLKRCLQAIFSRHGDCIASQYAGSAAMHKDALGDSSAEDEEDDEDEPDNAKDASGKRGKRQTMDAPDDNTTRKSGGGGLRKAAGGTVSNVASFVKRYYKNRFTDADKQASINLHTGDYIPHPTGKATKGRPKPEKDIWDLDATKRFNHSLELPPNQRTGFPYPSLSEDGPDGLDDEDEEDSFTVERTPLGSVRSLQAMRVFKSELDVMQTAEQSRAQDVSVVRQLQRQNSNLLFAVERSKNKSLAVFELSSPGQTKLVRTYWLKLEGSSKRSKSRDNGSLN